MTNRALKPYLTWVLLKIIIVVKITVTQIFCVYIVLPIQLKIDLWETVNYNQSRG